MKNSVIISIFLGILAFGIIFGIVLPWMISLTSTLMVFCGILVIFLIATLTALYINKLYKDNKKQ